MPQLNTQKIIVSSVSSLRSVTRTFYFESGELVATGTHDELMASQQGYEELYKKSLSG